MNLARKGKPEYGQSYEAHCLEIYKLFVEMADRISQRRQTANSFFLSINTALIAAVGYVGFGKKDGISPEFYILIAAAGMVLCGLWFFLILSYRNLNTAKFKVIHEIEKLLPLAPYDAEWDIAGKGKKPWVYWPFTHIEMIVPWVFFALHTFVLLSGQSQRDCFW